MYLQLAGVLLIGHGSLSLAKVTELRSIFANEELTESVPTIVICIGVFIFLISIFGCFGALKSNICLLETYSILLLVLVLFQVCLACFIFLYVGDIKIDTQRSFDKMWRLRPTSRDNAAMVGMIEESLQCCGNNGPNDYTADSLPKTCCLPGAGCSHAAAFPVGCRSHLQESIKTSAQMISYVCIATAIFELSAAVMGFILSGFIRKVNSVRRCCYGY